MPDSGSDTDYEVISGNDGSPYKNFPNLRPVTIEANGTAPACKLKLYRSSRPDTIDEGEMDAFRSLGVKAIIDLRNMSDHRTRVIDQDYPVYNVKLPKMPITDDSEVELKPWKPESSAGNVPEDDNMGRFVAFITFFGMDYYKTMCKRLAWYQILYVIFLVIYDYIRCDRSIITAKRYVTRHTVCLQPRGLVNTYIDFIDHCKSAIYSALTLLSVPANSPALVNCAHGKDRTGIICALVQHICGASRKQIAADYAQSEINWAPFMDRLRAEIEYYDLPDFFTETKEQSIIETFEYIEIEWGSVENFLEYIGFGEEAQQRLRTTLII